MMNNIYFFNYTDPEFEIVKAIRTAVFTKEQGAKADEEFDLYDACSVFALLYENEKAVATARIAQTDKGCKIGRIAVLRECRGKGYGAGIVRAVTEKAFGMGFDTVYVDAQNYAVPFYEKLGFKVIGSEITDRGLAHIPMCTDKGEFYGKEEK
ncbi:MAG: GNAT family N-acetyltransferase [Clostridium sp.]|nr:GNAT family N-acetyltransferase [Clostridium sp.]